MFRTRGKPDDPLNMKVAEQHKHLKDAIQINPLNYFGGSATAEIVDKQKELQRRRQHFDKFRETYQERLQKYQKKNGILRRTSEFSIGPFPEGSPSINAVNERKPVYMKAPLKPMRTVTVEIPLVAKQNAVWCRGKLNSTSAIITENTHSISENKIEQSKKIPHKGTCEFLRKLNQIENDTKKPERKDNGVQASVFKEIEEVKEEIGIAERQLKQINSLIESKKLAASRGNQTITENPKTGKSSTTWMVENGPKPKQNDLKGAKRLATTLSVLSRRLQEMQDKFKSKSTYKSIRDYLAARQSVEVIYKNRNFKGKAKAKALSSDKAVGEFSGTKLQPTLEQLVEKCNIGAHTPKKNSKLSNVTKPSPRKEIVPPNVTTVATDTNKEDEMRQLFDIELLNSIMKSKFLQKEFREVNGESELKIKKQKAQGPMANTIFSSADLVRL